MKLILDIRSVKRIALPAVAAALLTSSCSLMHDDLPDCATRPETRVTVNFIYDYNTDIEDHFADNIGSVTLYVFDADGRLVRQVEETASAHGLKQPGHSMKLDLPAGTYQLYASARESEDGYDAAMQLPGAKFRRTAAAVGDPFENLLYTLDHSNGTVDHQQQPLEHFWLTQQMTQLVVTEAPIPAEGDPQPADVEIQATVPLQRVTNNLHLTITRGNAPTANLPTLSENDYDVWVQTTTGRHELDLLGRPTLQAQPLVYRPYSYTSTRAGVPALTAELAMSRLMFETDAAQHTRLHIRSRLSGEEFSWDLPALLARGREADDFAPHAWSEQEYLDREYDYNLAVEFTESDDGWRYVTVSVAINDWSVVIQNVDF